MAEQNNTQIGQGDQTQYKPQSEPVQDTTQTPIFPQDPLERQDDPTNLFKYNVGKFFYSACSGIYKKVLPIVLPIASVIILSSLLGYGADYLTRDNSARDKNFRDKTYTLVDGVYFERKGDAGISLEKLMNEELNAAQKKWDNNVKKTDQTYDTLDDKVNEEAKKAWDIDSKKKVDEKKQEGVDYIEKIDKRRKEMKLQ